jgi:polar amino acid transport system substrate-binding protein
VTLMRRGVLGVFAIGLLSAAFGLAAQAQQPQGGILADVLKRGVLRVATVGGNPPYSTVGPDGKPVGYDIDIANLLAEQLKLKIEFTVTDSPGRITALQTHKVDVTFANFTANVERSKVIAFTDPYLVVGSIYMVPKDSPIQSVEQLNDAKYKVSMPRGGTAEGIITASAPKVQKVRFDTVNDAFLAMQSGQVDAHLQDSLQNADYLAKNQGKFRNLPGNWSYEEISIGLPAGDFDWWRVLNIFVKNLNASGENNRLFKKWFNYDMPPIQQKY